MFVVKNITGMIAKGAKVTCLTGNHDEMLRKVSGVRLGSFQIANKKLISINGKSAWIFHGDVFDVTMKYSKWLGQLGAVGYDMLILINEAGNWILKCLGKGTISLSIQVKNRVTLIMMRYLKTLSTNFFR